MEGQMKLKEYIDPFTGSKIKYAKKAATKVAA